MDGPHRRSAVTRIADCCGVNRRQVYRWVRGQSKIKAFYKKKINEEFNQEIFTL